MPRSFAEGIGEADQSVVGIVRTGVCGGQNVGHGFQVVIVVEDELVELPRSSVVLGISSRGSYRIERVAPSGSVMTFGSLAEW